MVSLSAAWHVLRAPGELAEGLLWGGWLVSSIKDVSEALYIKEGQGARKANEVWEARKGLFFTECALLSSASMFVSWLDRAGIFPLGSLISFTDVLGYGGSAILAGKRLIIEVKGLFSFKQNPKERFFVVGYLNKFIAVAFNATLTAWGVLHIFALVGLNIGVSLAKVDQLFIASVVIAVFYCVIYCANYKPESSALSKEVS